MYTKYKIHTRFIIDTRNIHETPFDTRNTYMNYKFENTKIYKTRKFLNFTSLIWIHRVQYSNNSNLVFEYSE